MYYQDKSQRSYKPPKQTCRCIAVDKKTHHSTLEYAGVEKQIDEKV